MIGTRLANRYELAAELGRGSTGTVYRANDPLLARELAIKIVPPERLDEGSRERFQREARLVAQMDHPAIVPIHDFGRQSGALYFVMPLVRGTTLRHLLEEERLADTAAARLATEVADALAYSHARGIVHRDIKPENIMVESDGEERRVRVMDFGLAAETSDPQATGGAAGTPAYLSPEQLQPRGARLDPRCDIYSLGAVLYECLAGTPPFDAPLPVLLDKLVRAPPPPLAEHGVEVEAELEEIVCSCLAKQPEDRPDAVALAARLRGFVGGASRQDPEGDAEAGHSGPLVGRLRERSLLRERLRAVLGSECHLVLLGGEIGIGKSRLLQELADLAEAQQAIVLRGQYGARGESFPYQGFCELIADGARRRVESESAASRKPGSLEELADELAAVFPQLAGIGVTVRAVPDPSHFAGEQRSALAPTYVFELLARALLRLAAGGPMVLILEDLHGAGTSLDALAYIVHRLTPTPTLVIGTYRPEDVERGHPLARLLDGFRDHARALLMRLEPLDREEIRQLAERLSGDRQLSEGLVDRLVTAGEGNPLFTQELMCSLLETDSLRLDADDHLELIGEAMIPAGLPLTIRQALERRLEQLPERLYELLALASVLGGSFTEADLEALTEDIEGLDDAVEILLHRGLLVEDRSARGHPLNFASTLVRDTLYRDLPPRRRRHLHRRYAFRLEARSGGRRKPVEALLAHHFAAGEVAEKAFEYALRQARRALAAWSPEDAVHACRLGLEQLGEAATRTPRRRGELEEILARAYRAAGENLRAHEHASRALEAYEEADAPRETAAAALLAARCAWQARRVEAARQSIDRGLVVARQAGDPGLLRRLLALGATVAHLRGDARLARSWRDEAERLLPGVDGPGEGPVPQGGTLRVGVPVELGQLDPARLTSDEEAEVVMTMFETLLRLDTEGNLVPGLAADWEGSADHRRYVFTLRREIVFTDGHPMGAVEVKASLERLAKERRVDPVPALPLIEGWRELRSGQSETLRGLRVVSDQGDSKDWPQERLVVELRESLPLFPALLADPHTAVVRPVTTPGGGTRLVGSGPFCLVRQDERRVVLERNICDWQGRLTALEGIELSPGLSSSETLRGLQGGEIDLGRDLLPDDLEKLLGDPRFHGGLVEASRKNVVFVLFNATGPSSHQVELRRALIEALRPHELVWRTLGRFALPAVGLIPPGILGHDPGRRFVTSSPDVARQRLEAAGIETPQVLRAVVSPALLGRCRLLVEAMVEAWAELGIEMRYDPDLSYAEFLKSYRDNVDVDLLIGRWNGDYDDPDTYTYGLFHSRHGLLRAWVAGAWSDPAGLDPLLSLSRREADASHRQSHYHRIEDELRDTALVLPLFHGIAHRVSGPRVRALRLSNVLPYVNYTELGKLSADPTPRRTILRGFGETLELAAAVPLETFDPASCASADQLEVTSTVFECLTRFTPDARLEPWLATAIEPEEEGRRFRIALREGVHFHDGRRLTAHDVRSSFERALRDPTGVAGFILLAIRGARAVREAGADELTGVQIMGDHELVVELEDPFPLFPVCLANPSAAIVPEGGQPGDGNWRGGWVGTGPFRVGRMDGGELELERHPEYWRQGVPKSEQLRFAFDVTPERIAERFRSGHLALAGELGGAETEALRRDPIFARGYLESPRLATHLLVFNRYQGALAERSLRRALAAAIDVEAVLRGTAGRRASRARSLVPPGLIGHEERATPRLWQARVGPTALAGLRLRAVVHPRFLAQDRVVWQRLVDQLQELGIDLDITPGNFDDVVRAIRAGEADIAFYRWVADYPDPDAFHQLFAPPDGLLSALCGSPELGGLVARGRRERDPERRHAIYCQLEEEIEREALIVPLCHEQTYRFAQPWVGGLRVGCIFPEIYYEELFIKR